MIEFESVTFSYPGARQPAIRELSLHIHTGERVCVLGANGSGKSTFARLVAGLLDPAEGKVSIDGKPPGSAATGFLFQNVDNQIVAATVAKDIAFGLENYAVEPPAMVDRVRGALRQFKIESLAARLSAELSGGEKQRVALASVMVLSPEMLILDEPDSFLDMAGQKLLRQELASVRENYPELTEIRITQYPEVARQYERVMIFDRGSVVADGAPADVLLDENLLKRTSLLLTEIELEQDTGWNFAIQNQGVGEVSALLFEGVSFGYDSRQLLADLSFRIDRGSCIGLVGESGTGKSTVLQLMCGLVKPDAGEIFLVDGGNRRARRTVPSASVSAVLQQPERQFFLPTCAEEIGFGPANTGVELSHYELKRLLELVGLDISMVRRDPYTLSGGEQRRLAFATVLSLRPSFMAFDEPASGLDRDGVARFIALSRNLARSGIGQLIISHDGEIIERLTDRVIVLGPGKGHKEMSTEEFFVSGCAAEVVSPPTVSHTSK